VLRLTEDLVHYAVAVVLIVVAAVVLYNTAHTLIHDLIHKSAREVPAAATTAVNGVLFAIIVLEVMRTVVAHFEQAGLQLQPFLIIGIISAVREILTVGARLSLLGNKGEPTTAMVNHALLELGVNAAVVLGLAGALVLIRRLGGLAPD
jgi:uncharacterized membrane protein (DUF373 family)